MASGPGGVWACGAGQYANGKGDRETTFTPRHSQAVSSLQIGAISCGNMVSMGIDAAGGLYTWGKWGEQEDSVPRKVELDVVPKSVTLHHEQPYGVVLSEDGALYAWGKSDDFLTGLGAELHISLDTHPKQIGGFDASVVHVSLGAHHAVAITSSGKLYSWGSGNGLGLDPMGSMAYHPTPMEVVLPNNELAADAAAGDGFTIVCTQKGAIYTFGDIPTENWMPTLQSVAYSSKFVNVSAGNRHALILAEDGAVFGIGCNGFGELGLGDDVTDKQTPVQIPSINSVVRIRAYKSSSFAINGNGEIYVWGENNWGYLGMGHIQAVRVPSIIPTFAAIPIVDVGMGYNHTLFLQSTKESIPKLPMAPSGSALPYPDVPQNYYKHAPAVTKGQVWATGSIVGTELEPSEEVMVWRPVPTHKSNPMVDAKTARRAGYAAGTDGTVYVWGTGAVGGGSDEGKSYGTPAKLWDLDGMRVGTLQSGQGDWAMALTVEGRLYGFGDSQNFRTGLATESKVVYPTLLELPSPVKKFSVGKTHGICVTQDYGVFTWGKGKGLGNGGRNDTERTPKRVIGMEYLGLCDLGVGNNFTVALTRSGDVYSWGEGTFGKLGHGDDLDQVVPKKIAFFGSEASNKVVQISAGLDFVLALTEEGTVFSWGRGGEGCLGLGYSADALSNKNTPQKLHFPSKVGYLFTSELSAFAVLETGELYAWGAPNLGVGTGRTVAYPIRAYSLMHARVLSVGAGDWQSVAVVAPKSCPGPIPPGRQEPWAPVPLPAPAPLPSPPDATTLSPSTSTSTSASTSTSTSTSTVTPATTGVGVGVIAVDPARHGAHEKYMGNVSSTHKFFPDDPEIDAHAWLGHIPEVREFLTNSRGSWCPSPEEAAILKLAVGQVKPDENVIKSWIVYSINKKDFELQRVLIVTDKALYRMKYEDKKKEVVHVKRWPAMSVYQVLCGKFKDESGAVSSKMRGLIEKDPYEHQCGIQIWTQNPKDWQAPSVLPFQKITVPYTTYRPHLQRTATPEENVRVCAEICVAITAAVHFYRNGSQPIDYLNEFAIEAPKRFDGAPVFPAKKVEHIARAKSMGVLAAAHNKWFTGKTKH